MDATNKVIKFVRQIELTKAARRQKKDCANCSYNQPYADRLVLYLFDIVFSTLLLDVVVVGFD
jgi:hypothetical protein